MKIFKGLVIITVIFLAKASYAQYLNKPPKVEMLMIDGKKAPAKVYLNPGEKYMIKVLVIDPEKDRLIETWELFSEAEIAAAVKEKRKPVAIPDKINGPLENVMLDVPYLPGAYKLFLKVTDTHKNSTSVSMPLVVLQ